MANSSSISSFKHYAKIGGAAALSFWALNLLLLFGMRQIDALDAVGRSLSDGRFHGQDADVLFMGDSRTHQGLDPAIFSEAISHSGGSLSALNLAAPAMQGPFYYFVLKDYLDHAAKPPQVIVADISFFMLGGAERLKDIYLAYYTPNAAEAADTVHSHLLIPTDAATWFIRTRIPAMRYNRSFSGLIDSFAENPAGLPQKYEHAHSIIPSIDSPASRGYLQVSDKKHLDAVSMEELKYNDIYNTGFENGYQAYQDYFKRFFNLAATNHIHVIIYPFPWPMKAKTSEHFRQVYDFYDQLIKGLAKDNPYVHFVDYDYFWTPDNFSDSLHMDRKGAARLSTLAACWVMHQKTGELDKPCR